MAVHRYRILGHTPRKLITEMGRKIQEAPESPIRITVQTEAISPDVPVIGGDSAPRRFTLLILLFAPGEDAWMAIQDVDTGEGGTIRVEDDHMIIEVVS